MSVYQARPVKRRRRSRRQVRQLEQQIFDVLKDDHPQSVRHVFYRMTDPRLPEPIEKSDRGYTQVQERITRMRRANHEPNGSLTIPYGWIADASRRGYHTITFRNASEALRTWQGGYRADLWSNAGTYVEVWVESRSIAGVIAKTCEELAVSLYPAGGFTSLTLAYEAARSINRIVGTRCTPVNIVYIGDYDPAGVLIDRKVEEELRQHLSSAIKLDFRRIAITPEQIEQLALPTKPRKPGERRSRHVVSTVEAEAMPAGVMRRLLRDEIESFLPEGALRAVKAAEESERRQIEWVADFLDLDRENNARNEEDE